MTESELYTSITLVTLLIVGLMGWLMGEFTELSNQHPPLTREQEFTKLCLSQIWTKPFFTSAILSIVDPPEYTTSIKFRNQEPYNLPKRRKYRDNPQRGK